MPDGETPLRSSAAVGPGQGEHRIGGLVSAVHDKVAGLWTQHRERIATNPDYPTAIAAAVAAMTKLFTDDPALLTLAAALAGLYVAIHHATRRDNWRPRTNPWEPHRPSWEDRWDDNPDWP
jgi:hypothetical protein